MNILVLLIIAALLPKEPVVKGIIKPTDFDFCRGFEKIAFKRNLFNFIHKVEKKAQLGRTNITSLRCLIENSPGWKLQMSTINLDSVSFFGTIYFKGRRVMGLSNHLANNTSTTEYEQQTETL